MASASEVNGQKLTMNGNLRFCNGCQNLMIAKSQDNLLIWECSIECSYSQTPGANQQLADTNGSVIVLSQTTDSDFTHGQNPRNDFTRYDPTLLRTLKVCPNKDLPVHRTDPDVYSEMVVFKQNLVTADSYYICTVCDKRVNLV